MAILQLQNVSKNFGGLAATSNLDMEVREGQVHALIGPNGAGKTTVFNMITGVYRVSAGDIRFNDRSIVGVAPHKIVKLGIARTYQNIRLFKKVSALQNVMTGFHGDTQGNPFNVVFRPGKIRAEEERVRRESERILDYMGILNVRDELAGSLPYGHQRLLEIARALATSPKLLLLDEPAAGMNSEEKQSLIETINRIRRDFRLTVLLVEHDMELVMNISDRITVLNFGRKIAEAAPQEVQKNPEVIRAYLGGEKHAGG